MFSSKYALLFVLPLCLFAEKLPDVKGLVARYVAADVEEGKEVKVWPARAGSNPKALVEAAKVQDSQVVPPLLKTVNVNGFQHPALLFSKGAAGEGELLIAEDLLPEGHAERTVFVAYRLLSRNLNGSARVAGFGSNRVEGNADLKVWNFGIELGMNQEQGSFRFNGSFIGPNPGTPYVKGQLMLRAMLQHADGSFSDYLQPSHDFFNITQTLKKGRPQRQLGKILGDFVVGDLHEASVGGAAGQSEYELFELLVYDRELTAEEIQQLLEALNWRYTNPLPEKD